MKASKTCVAATRFQYDYLNDDINDFGQIDYSISNKVPAELQAAIKSGKKILVLINPPYAESGDTLGSEAKSDVASTKFSNYMDAYGFATRELFAQFIARIKIEIPNAIVGVFSTLKYVNAPNFEKFRSQWNSKYLSGFVVHNKAFDGLKGDFPIGFLIWETNQAGAKNPITEISTEVLNKQVNPIGEKKFFNLPSSSNLNNWIERPKPNKTEVVPLKNAVHPAVKVKDVRGRFWSDGAIGQMLCDSNDLQHASQRTALFSSGYCSAGAYYVTPDNFWKSTVIFTVRRIIKPTWLNDRDQFLQPTKPLSEEFKTDCLIWMLFNGSNLSASANDLEWNDKKWSIVNHFIPFTEAEVGAPSRFESDFMVKYLADKTLSAEAKVVLDEGRKLWQAYFAKTDSHTVREALKLNRADVGWYQVRKALEARNADGDSVPVSFEPFKTAYDALSAKLRPMVYELGFMR